MKVTVPEKEVELCDCCHREGVLYTCKSCGKRYCLMCHAIIPGCMLSLDVCRKCEKSPAVLAISASYAPKFKALANERDAELAALRETTS